MANSSVPRSVPTAVAPSAQNSVSYLTGPQLGPLNASQGSSTAPKVPRPEGAPETGQITPNPVMGAAPCTTGMELESGSSGAPTVPDMNGVLFRKGPADTHYQNEYQGGHDPYRKVNNPATRGWFTFVKMYLNGIATSQDVDLAGWKARHPQQRTSVMRFQPPPHGGGYAPEIYEPAQQPQNPNTYKYNPQLGTQAYGTGVLNSDTYGAGQTAGGIGGNRYTPTPGPPETQSTAGQPTGSGEPSWG